MIIRPAGPTGARSIREFEVKTLGDFAARVPREDQRYEKLARPVLERVPFQPDWAVANPALNWQAYLESPPHKRHLLRLTDGQYHRLELFLARERDTRERFEDRREEERNYVRQLTAKLSEAEWLERHELWVETYWNMLDRTLKFIRDRRAQREAVLEYRRALEKVTKHEYEILKRFAEAREQRHQDWHSLWYRDMYQLTSNNSIVRLPQYGRSLQFVLGQHFRREAQGVVQELLEWRLGDLYTLTPNGVIVPLPHFGLPSSSVLAGLEYARDIRHLPDTRRQMAKRHAEVTRRAVLQTDEHQDQVLDLQRARQRAHLRKLIEERRRRPPRTWVDQAQDMAPKLAEAVLGQRGVPEQSKLLRAEVVDERAEKSWGASAQNPGEGIEGMPLRQLSAFEAPAGSAVGSAMDSVSKRDGAPSQERPGVSQDPPRVLGAAERPQIFKDGFDRIIVKIEDDGARERDRLKVKRLRENLAAQAAGAASQLSRHVESTPMGESRQEQNVGVPLGTSSPTGRFKKPV